MYQNKNSVLNRCPRYENVPAECGATLPDVNDPCCNVPSCPSNVTYVPVPAYAKSTQTVSAVKAPGVTDLINGMFTARYTFVYSAFTVAPPTTPSGTIPTDSLLGKLRDFFLCTFFQVRCKTEV